MEGPSWRQFVKHGTLKVELSFLFRWVREILKGTSSFALGPGVALLISRRISNTVFSLWWVFDESVGVVVQRTAEVMIHQAWNSGLVVIRTEIFGSAVVARVRIEVIIGGWKALFGVPTWRQRTFSASIWCLTRQYQRPAALSDNRRN